MTSERLQALLENEREWRKYLIEKLDGIECEQTELKSEVRVLKVWIWIWRTLGAAFVSAIFYNYKGGIHG